MIEQHAIVTRAENGQIWLHSQKQSACCGCKQQAHCGTAALAQTMHSNTDLQVECGLDVQTGDEVRLQIDEASLLSSVLLLYGLPLVLMLVTVGLAHLWWSQTQLEQWLPELALAVLLAAFWLVHRFSKRLLQSVSADFRIIKD